MKRTIIKEKMIHYGELLQSIKARIRQGQAHAVLSANAEMIHTYWDVGRMICDRQREEGWGAGVLPRLAKDIHNELPEVKGFSIRNLRFMVQFYKEYQEVNAIVKQPVSQLPVPPEGKKSRRAIDRSAASEEVKQLVPRIPWGHNVLLMQRIKDKAIRFWYMQKTIEQGWGRDVLALMMKSEARSGQSDHRFNPLPGS